MEPLSSQRSQHKPRILTRISHTFVGRNEQTPTNKQEDMTVFTENLNSRFDNARDAATRQANVVITFTNPLSSHILRYVSERSYGKHRYVKISGVTMARGRRRDDSPGNARCECRSRSFSHH